MYQRDMPEEAASKLRTICGFEEGAELPQALVDTYWRAKVACDRLSLPAGDVILVLVSMLAGNIPPEQPPTILDLIRARQVKVGDEVRVKWRGRLEYATLLGVNAKQGIRFQLNGEERELDAALVFATDRDRAEAGV